MDVHVEDSKEHVGIALDTVGFAGGAVGGLAEDEVG
jgi:hypothetical protein